MTAEEIKQYEMNKLIHNKIAKEFQAKARMNSKIRRMMKKNVAIFYFILFIHFVNGQLKC